MSNYVKYTAADGTVHLCHEDSSMLMHANSGNQATKMAWNTFITNWKNLLSFCNKNGITYNKSGSTYTFSINYKDGLGKTRMINVGEAEINEDPQRVYKVFIDDQKWRDRVDNATTSISNAMVDIKDTLKKYRMMPDGYYKSR